MNKSKVFRASMLFIVGLFAVGSTAAYTTGLTSDYAESEQVTDFDTVSSEVYVQVTGVTGETVDLEFYLDDETVETVSNVELDSSGESYVQLDSSATVDQVSIAPTDTDPSNVSEVTVNYNYSGSDTSALANYSSSQAFTSFEVVDYSPTDIIGKLVPWLVVLALVGMMANKQ